VRIRKLTLFIFSIALASAAAGPNSKTQKSHTYGKFHGKLKLTEVGDGVHWTVLDDFSYTHAGPEFLEAQRGFQTDGASIPRPLWTFVGSPFTGKYVDAAVIHDVGCVSHKYSWQATHRIFYDAMIDSGVGERLADVLYFGVRLGGPKWELETAQARSIGDLNAEVLREGGTVIQQIETKKSSGLAGGPTTYFAHFFIPLPTNSLSEQEIRNFQAEWDRRQLSGKPISVAEIESRTEATR
jgi:hypothetical protein